MVKKCYILMRVEDGPGKDSGSEDKHIAIIDSAFIFRRNSTYWWIDSGLAVSDKREVEKWKEQERGRGNEYHSDSISGLSIQVYVGLISQQWILEAGEVLEENLFSSIQFERPVEKERG